MPDFVYLATPAVITYCYVNQQESQLENLKQNVIFHDLIQ